ncbi:MAG: EAL domain-containing protein [Alphaproteobacteria bacterium]|nr:EAL domain-containing protein [Alphaproteobacteria bacterium]
MATTVSREREGFPPDWVKHFVDEIPSGIAVFDPELRYLAANPRWINAFHLSAMPLAGRRHDELDPVGSAGLIELQRRALSGDTAEGCADIENDAAGRMHQRVISTRPRVAPDGSIIGVIAALHEVVTVNGNERVEETSDRLTGVGSRSSFLARLSTVLQSGPGTAVFLLDIDNFKGINDLCGARVGDIVLKAVAARLVTGTRSRTLFAAASQSPSDSERSDLVARLGADEFGIVLGAPATPAESEAFARRLLQIVRAPIITGERRIRLTACIGYLTTGATHQREEDVLRDLDVALQEAKMRGPNTVKAWEPALTSAMGRRLAMLDQLHRAVDEGEFVLHYQPILSLKDGQVVGAEALLRWNHPSDGLVPPAVFLPLLEESGLIVPVGCWVIRDVVRQMQVWHMLYGRAMVDWVSVNVSPRQFNDPAPLLATLNEINESGFAMDRLRLELTESAFMRNPDMARAVLKELREFGIRVALDDFGTGYSALGALRQYAVDTIKIDCDFTARLDTLEGKELVLALLKIAGIYGADVVAEGVETPVQRDALRDAGCGFAQGFLFAKPMDGRFFGAYALTHLVESDASL